MDEGALTVVDGLLRVGRIYREPAVRDHAQGREILERFPGAEVVGVSHVEYGPYPPVGDPEGNNAGGKIPRVSDDA